MAERNDSTAPKLSTTTEAHPLRWQPKVLEGGKGKDIKRDEKKTGGRVPPKRLGLKIGVPIAGFFVLTTGVGIGLGESKKLPEPLQEGYGHLKEAVGLKNRISYDQDGTPVVDVTETTKAPETTQAPTTTVAETTTTQEATTTTEAIINAPEIKGLRFDQATKIYIAEAGNPYGLEAGIEAGVYVKDAIEINGKMKDSIDLKQEVINFLQDKLFKKTKDYFVMVPLSLKNLPGVKMNELEVDIGPAKGEKTLGIVAPKNSVFCAPFSGEWTLIWDEDRLLSIFIDIGEPDRGAGGVIYFKEAEIIPTVIKTDKAFNSKTNKEIKIEILDVRLGESLGRIIGEATLDLLANRTNMYHFNTPGEYQLGFTPVGRDRSIGGVDRLMKIGEDCFVSVLSETAYVQTK